MNNEWITDRKPEHGDGWDGYVWKFEFNKIRRIVRWNDVQQGEPWMPITPPEPYVKPKRYKAKSLYELCGDSELRDSGYCVYDEFRDEYICDVPTREAAERIAAIYEEMLS